MIQLWLCDKDKTRIKLSDNQACFAALGALRTAVPADRKNETWYLHYLPGEYWVANGYANSREFYSKGTEELRRQFFSFISNLWFMPKLLEGQTYDSVLKDGVFLDATKHSALDIFNTLNLIRYMDEHDGIQCRWGEYIQAGLSPYQAFLMVHFVQNVGHMLFYATLNCQIDDVTPDEVKWPTDYPSWMKYPNYLENPKTKRRRSTSFPIEEVLRKYPRVQTVKIPDFRQTYGYSICTDINDLKHFYMPKTFGPHPDPSKFLLPA